MNGPGGSRTDQPVVTDEIHSGLPRYVAVPGYAPASAGTAAQPGAGPAAVGREALPDSMRDLLGRNVGHYVVAVFSVEQQRPTLCQGVLHSVGDDYLAIYQPERSRMKTCDLGSLRFLEFRPRK